MGVDFVGYDGDVLALGDLGDAYEVLARPVGSRGVGWAVYDE